MGVIRDNRTSIVSGGLISASYVSDVYDVLTGNTVENISFSGSVNITGSLIGNLTGTAQTASYVTLAQTASYVTLAQTASYVENAISSSYMSGSNVISTSGSIEYLEVTTKFISEGTAFIYTASLPTSDPSVNGQLWRSGSYLMISTGSGS
jgi:hypothetical protein